LAKRRPEDERAMTVLVTGAAGFLGRRLTMLLAAREGQTRALVHPARDAGWQAPPGVDRYHADIADKAAIINVMADGSVHDIRSAHG